MPTPLLGVSLQPRWPLEDGTAPLRAASHAEDLGFDHVAVRNRLLDSGFGLDTDPLVLRRRLHELAGDAGNADRLTLASAAFLTPPGIPAAVPSPGRPLGGAAPTAASVVNDLGHLAEAGLTTCTAWLPVAAEHVDKAMEWVATEVMPQLT